MDNIEYRIIKQFEFKYIAQLRWIFQTEETDTLDRFNKTQFINECTKILLKPELQDLYTHFGAFINGSLISVASLSVINKIPRPHKLIDPIGYLTNVFTLTEYRNQKIGSSLLKFIHIWAKSKDLELIIVWPSDKSLSFYNNLDYHATGHPLVYKLREY